MQNVIGKMTQKPRPLVSYGKYYKTVIKKSLDCKMAFLLLSHKVKNVHAKIDFYQTKGALNENT